TEAGLRYATGNGNLEAHVRLGGAHTVEPAGSFEVRAEAMVLPDSLIHVAVDGNLLESPLLVRLDMRPRAMETLAADVAVAIPARTIHGAEWGPVRVEGHARPGHAPKVDVAVNVPGVEVTAKTEDEQSFDLRGALVARSLAAMSRAVGAL